MKANPSECQELVHSVLETLEQGEALLTQLSDEDYTRKVAVAFNASIGGHYRHCLDHFRSLLDAANEVGRVAPRAPSSDMSILGAHGVTRPATPMLNYDHRERGTLIESDRFAALNATRELREGYEHLDPMSLMRSLNVTCKTSYATSGSQASPSTVGREIMYSVAHAVHHYALIGIMRGVMGLRMPTGFGVAPSTLKHQAEAAKAAL
jgi:hypothetical protein